MAPVSPDVTVWYRVGDFNVKGPIGLEALKGRDGSDAWLAATGEFATPAQGFPAQVGSVIYTEGSLAPGGPGKLSAVRATDGHILWQEPLPFPSDSYLAAFTMAADTATVLLTDRHSGLYALDTATGKTRWHVDGPLEGTFIHQLAVGGGVAVALAPGARDGSARLVVYREDNGHLLWYGPEYPTALGLTLGVNAYAVYIVAKEATDPGLSALVAYDTRSGRTLWRDALTGGIVAVTDQTVLLGDPYSENGDNGKSNNIVCLDAVSGALKWQANGTYNQWYELSASQTAVYVPTTSNPTAVKAISLATGMTLWHWEVGDYLPGAVMEEDGVAFAFLQGPQNLFGSPIPNRLVALDAQTGKIYWERDLPDNY
jgi:outer membrane protein assembly factor BamB